jgi:hypothetical protein
MILEILKIDQNVLKLFMHVKLVDDKNIIFYTSIFLNYLRAIENISLRIQYVSNI